MERIYSCNCKLCKYENKNKNILWIKKNYIYDKFIKWKRTSFIAWRGYDLDNNIYAIKYIWGSIYIKLEGNKIKNYLNIPKILLWIESITNIINFRIN